MDEVPAATQGDRCVCGGAGPQRLPGTVMFVGVLPKLGPGMWVGVHLDDPLPGATNGRVEGRRIFDCPKNHGGFFRAAEVEIIEREPPASPRVSPAGSRTGSPAFPLSDDEGGGGDGATAVAGAVVPDAAVEAEPGKADPEACVAAGRGLRTAVVNQLAQFVVTAHDAYGGRVPVGGASVSVQVRGTRPPSNLRVRLKDLSNGSYLAEYRPEVSGEVLVLVSVNGVPIAGSPFAVSVVTLRPEPSRCLLHGDGLRLAVARVPTTFNLDFVDSLGHSAYGIT